MTKMLLVGIGLAAQTLAAGVAAETEPERRSADAEAERAPRHAIEIEGRVGYGLPVGKVWRDFWMSELAGEQVPIGLGVGYRIDPNWSLGASMQYGIVHRTDDTKCISLGETCSAADTRLAALVQYRASPRASVSPWVGLGVGYEWFTASGRGMFGPSYSGKLMGFELANLQLGADFKTESGFTLGPYLSGSLDWFLYQSHTDGYSTEYVGTTSIDLDAAAFHGWLMFGARGTYDIGI